MSGSMMAFLIALVFSLSSMIAYQDRAAWGACMGAWGIFMAIGFLAWPKRKRS